MGITLTQGCAPTADAFVASPWAILGPPRWGCDLASWLVLTVHARAWNSSVLPPNTVTPKLWAHPQHVDYLDPGLPKFSHRSGIADLTLMAMRFPWLRNRQIWIESVALTLIVVALYLLRQVGWIAVSRAY